MPRRSGRWSPGRGVGLHRGPRRHRAGGRQTDNSQARPALRRRNRPTRPTPPMPRSVSEAGSGTEELAVVEPLNWMRRSAIGGVVWLGPTVRIVRFVSANGGVAMNGVDAASADWLFGTPP